MGYGINSIYYSVGGVRGELYFDMDMVYFIFFYVFLVEISYIGYI